MRNNRRTSQHITVLCNLQKRHKKLHRRWRKARRWWWPQTWMGKQLLANNLGASTRQHYDRVGNTEVKGRKDLDLHCLLHREYFSTSHPGRQWGKRKNGRTARCSDPNRSRSQVQARRREIRNYDEENQVQTELHVVLWVVQWTPNYMVEF